MSSINSCAPLRMLCFMLPVLLYGCAGDERLIVRSEKKLQAATLLERGVKFQSKGEIQQAQKCLADSLTISSSIEDNPSRIEALVNLARLNRLNHKFDTAILHIDLALMLAADFPDYSAEAAYEKALIELALDHFTEAMSWATKSLSYNARGQNGKHLNLLARINRATGNRGAAKSLATRAAEENRLNGQLEEESNSLRLLGSLERENKQFDSAKTLLLKSLDIDKQIGESQKIALDLGELATLSGDQGDFSTMLDYLERCFSVNLNGTRTQEAAATKLKMAEIYRILGKTGEENKALQTASQLMQNASPVHKSTPEIANPSSKP